MEILELVLSKIILVFNLVAFAVIHSFTASLYFKRLIVRCDLRFQSKHTVFTGI